MTAESSVEMTARALDAADLRPAIVLSHAIFHLEDLVERMEQLIEAQGAIIRGQAQVLKVYHDAAAEILDEQQHRRFVSLEVRKAEREAARTKLPLWFWRPEPELELKVQLYRRAVYLIHECGYSIDDVWDLLREFLDDYAHPETDVTDEQLAGVIDYAQRRGAAHACAA